MTLKRKNIYEFNTLNVICTSLLEEQLHHHSYILRDELHLPPNDPSLSIKLFHKIIIHVLFLHADRQYYNLEEGQGTVPL